MLKVILGNYGKGRYAVSLDGEIKYKNTSYAKSHVFAGELSGVDDFVDETRDLKPDSEVADKKSKESKGKKAKSKDK